MESEIFWGNITTEHITFEEFCQALMSIRDIEGCGSPAELADLLGGVTVVSHDTEVPFIKARFQDWGDRLEERFEDAFTALSATREDAHVHMRYSTPGESMLIHVRVPEVRHDEVAFGDLRSVLAHEPSPETFARLCEVIGDTQLEPRLLEYVRGHLATWPEHLERKAPTSWIWRHAHWGTCPQITLCETLEVPLDSKDHSHRYGESQRHESIRVHALTARELFKHFFEYERRAVETERRFMQEFSGVTLHADGGDMLLTFADPDNYNMRYKAEWLMQQLPDHFIHVYECNAWGDHVRMKLYRGQVLVYQEELRSPLPHEATVFDGRGEEVAFLIDDPPPARAAKLIEALRALMLEAGADPKDLLGRSHVRGWFDDEAPSTSADASARMSSRESFIGQRITRQWNQREAPASRAELEETLLDDSLPF